MLLCDYKTCIIKESAGGKVMRDLSKVKSLIIKIGSSSLCDDKGNINKEKILNLIWQITQINRKVIKTAYYTHLTLPTSDLGGIFMEEEAQKKKKVMKAIVQKMAKIHNQILPILLYW